MKVLKSLSIMVLGLGFVHCGNSENSKSQKVISADSEHVSGFIGRYDQGRRASVYFFTTCREPSAFSALQRELNSPKFPGVYSFMEAYFPDQSFAKEDDLIKEQEAYEGIYEPQSHLDCQLEVEHPIYSADLRNAEKILQDELKMGKGQKFWMNTAATAATITGLIGTHAALAASPIAKVVETVTANNGKLVVETAAKSGLGIRTLKFSLRSIVYAGVTYGVFWGTRKIWQETRNYLIDAKSKDRAIDEVRNPRSTNSYSEGDAVVAKLREVINRSL